MEKFTVKVDLSLFFEDERKNVVILVDPSLSTVDKFHKRVEELFNLKNIRFQTLEDCLVPAQESIEIIKYVHELRAFTGKLRKQSKPLLELNNNDINLLQLDIASDNKCHKIKRKFISLENGLKISPLSSAKRSKNWSSTLTVPKHNESNEITSTQNDNNVTKVEQSLNETKRSTSKQNLAVNNSNSSEHSERAAQKSTNVSVKSNKSLNSSQPKLSKDHRSKSNSFASSTLIESRQHQDCTEQQSQLEQTNRSHISMNEDLNVTENGDDLTLTKYQMNQPNIKFRCALEQKSPDTTARVFKDRSQLTKSPIVIQDQIIIQAPLPEIENRNSSANMNDEMTTSAQESHSNNSIIMELDEDSDTGESVIELNETVEDESSEEDTSNVENDEHDEIDIDKMLDQATDLSEGILPCVGDTLFFRLSYNNKMGSVISDYVAGPCEYVNKRTKTVKVCIAGGKHELSNLSPIYGCNLDDSLSIGATLNVKLVNLIEPKIIKKI